MKTMRLLAFMAVCILALSALPAFAGEFATCVDGRKCERIKDNFGVATVRCYQGDVLRVSWVCTYQAGYICRPEGSMDTMSDDSMPSAEKYGGIIPTEDSMCTHLCGDCESGWKE